jgi:2-haloacid dehalogenase
LLDFGSLQAITFDCYGTLIDWESGILSVLRPLLADHAKPATDAQLLQTYSELEPAAQAGSYRPYRLVLEEVVRGIGQQFGFSVSTDEARSLAASLRDWPPFPDTVAALRALKAKYRLGIISNTDDNFFAETARHLQVSFDWVITAEQARAYKPSRTIFDFALGRIGLSPDGILHAGQSIFHDVIPAQSIGMATALVRRRGFGAVKPASARPDLEVPDLKTLAAMALGEAPAG